MQERQDRAEPAAIGDNRVRLSRGCRECPCPIDRTGTRNLFRGSTYCMGRRKPRSGESARQALACDCGRGDGRMQPRCERRQLGQLMRDPTVGFEQLQDEAVEAGSLRRWVERAHPPFDGGKCAFGRTNVTCNRCSLCLRREFPVGREHFRQTDAKLLLHAVDLLDVGRDGSVRRGLRRAVSFDGDESRGRDRTCRDHTERSSTTIEASQRRRSTVETLRSA